MANPNQLVPGDPSDAQIAQLVGQLQQTNAPPKSGYLTMSQGVITAVAPTATPPTCSLTLSGGTNVIDGVRYLSSYTPVVGDTVQVLLQGGSPLVVGQIVNIGTSSASSGGWVTPTLSSGFTHNGNSNGNLMYRLFSQGGAWKVQWKGSVSHTGSNSAIISGANVLAPAYCPSDKRTMLGSRNTSGGSNDVQIEFGTDGSVTLLGANTFVNHTHGLGTSDVQLSGYNSQGGTDLGHAHGLGTSFSASGGALDPTWIGFNGIEYFL